MEAFFPVIAVGLGLVFLVAVLRALAAFVRIAIIVAIIAATVFYLQGRFRVSTIKDGLVIKLTQASEIQRPAADGPTGTATAVP